VTDFVFAFFGARRPVRRAVWRKAEFYFGVLVPWWFILFLFCFFRARRRRDIYKK
jgi:hypothetical protein